MAALVGTGRIDVKSVFPPKVGVRLLDSLGIAQKQVRIGERRGLPIVVQHFDNEGTLRQPDIRQLVPQQGPARVWYTLCPLGRVL